MRILAIVLLLSTGSARAEGEPAGEFDYYVLSLSWSPNWCRAEGDAQGSAQCADGSGFGWILHGLWPQYERGWPSFCLTTARDPSRAETAAMADIMGTSGLAWYQWKKHGRCTGLSADEYFMASRTAFDAVTRPAVFRRLTQNVTLPASLIEAAFLQENKALSPDMITITCKSDAIQEARICLSKDLEPRVCAADVARDCASRNASFAPIR